MRALYTQFSGLAGLIAFLNQLWSYAPLERTIMVGFGTGLGVYLLLILGDVTIHRILTQTPPTFAEESTRTAGGESKATKQQEQAKAKAA